MFCKYCGKEIVEGSKFCEECGKEVALPEETANEPEVKESVAAPEQPEEVTEAPVTEETPAEAVAEEAPVEAVVEENVAEPTFAEPQFDAPVKKGKKKKLFAILIPVIAVLVAAAVAATMFLDVVKGLAIKTFGSDEDYFKFVETKACGEITNEFSEIYGKALEALTFEDVGGEATVKLNVSDTVVDLLEETLEEETGESIDLDWLNTVALNMDVNAKNKVIQALLALNVNGKEFISADSILDIKNGEAFVALLPLSDEYLKAEIASEEEIQKVLEILGDEDLRKALPSQDEFDKLLNKYIEVVFENVDSVRKSSKTVEVGDVEEKLTVLKAEIDQEDLLDIASAVLKTAKKDKELKSYIKDVAKYLEKQELIPDADEVYDTFEEAIEQAIDDIDGTEIEDDDDSVLVLTDYVNSKHEIVGRKIEANGEEQSYTIFVREGNKVAYEYRSGEIVVEGEGTEKKDVANVKYTVKVDGDEIAYMDLIDFKTNTDYPNGKIRVSLSEELLDELDLDSSIVSALSIANPMIEFNFECSEKSSKIDFNIVSGEEVLVGLTFTSKEKAPSKIEKPDSSDAYDDADEWAENFDAQKLLDKLDEIGISTDFIGSLMAPSYEDDYYDDYDYDFDSDFTLDDDYSDYDFYY